MPAGVARGRDTRQVKWTWGDSIEETKGDKITPSARTAMIVFEPELLED